MMQGIVSTGAAFLRRPNPLSDYLLDKISARRGLVQRRRLPYTGGAPGGHVFRQKDFNVPGTEIIFDVQVDAAANLQDVPSVAGYVPHVKGQTRVIVYNFFARNYSIRKQILGRAVLGTGAEIARTVWFLLPADAVLTLDCAETFGDADGEYVIIELFHPRITFGHGGHDGHLRFWGSYGDYNSTSHSMPLPRVRLTHSAKKAHRRHWPETVSQDDVKLSFELKSIDGCSWVDDSIRGDFSAMDLNYQGYSCIYEQGDGNRLIPKAMWHESGYKFEPHNAMFMIQMVGLPNFDDIDAVIYFGEAITREEPIAIYFKDASNKMLSSVETRVTPKSEIRLSEVAEGPLDACSFVVIEFQEGLQSSVYKYVNVFYLTDGKIGDNVHCHPPADGRVVREGTVYPSLNAGPQCLKFMHFPAPSDHRSVLSVWGAAADIPIKLRVILEDRTEYLISGTLRELVVNHFDLNALFKKHDIPEDQAGVIQLESYRANPHGILSTYNAQDRSISVDHLTGG